MRTLRDRKKSMLYERTAISRKSEETIKGDMKEIEILGANRFETFTKTRSGSRAVIICNGKILLSHETKSGWWLVPGGGMEENETPEESERYYRTGGGIRIYG